jgi:hypothetical protein
MELAFVKPEYELQPYIESFWVFESPRASSRFLGAT